VTQDGGNHFLFMLEEGYILAYPGKSIFAAIDTFFQDRFIHSDFYRSHSHRRSNSHNLYRYCSNMITATNMFGITELNYKHPSRIPGFNVRLGWCNGKPSVNAEFSLKDYDSRGQALLKAILFRDKQLAKLIKEGKWPVEKSRTKPLKNNKSGVLGVSRTPQWSRNGPSKKIFVWQACWRDSVTNKAVSVKFSENKWGKETAFDMACACREAKQNIYKGIR